MRKVIEWEKLKFKGYGVELPKNTVNFKEQTRYRISGDEKQISLAVSACQKALKNANITISDVDCIVSASAVGIQPIPCMAALIHEKIAKGTSIPALDINTTCTSFITALDTMSYLLDVGRYKRVLIVSCDVASRALNPKQKESFQLFQWWCSSLYYWKNWWRNWCYWCYAKNLVRRSSFNWDSRGTK